MKPLLSVNDVCDVLSISRSTVYRLFNDGELTGYRVGTRLRFRPEEVEEYLEHHTRPVQHRIRRRNYLRPRVCPECGRERCRINHHIQIEPIDFDTLDAIRH